MVASSRVSSRRAALSIVLIFLLSTQLVLFQTPEALNDENSSFGVTGIRSSPGSVDVPEWAVGDLWTYDAFFDVEDLISSGAPGSSIGVLRGTLTKEVVDTTIMMIENQSTIVYVVESSGTFQKNGITLVAQGTSINADLRVSYDSDELIRASDLGQISYSQELDVDLNNIPFPASLLLGSSLALADISIGTQYSPPKEYYDFPMSVGEYWNTSVTTGTTWSGSVYQNLFELPEDSEEPSEESHGITAVGNPGVGYPGCATSLNATSFNSTGAVTGFRWYCPAAKGEAWWHQELDLGLQIDFKLLTYTPASRDPVISVETAFPAWPLNTNMGAWVNLTDPSTGSPLGNQAVQFRYESTGDYRSLSTATNGSAYVEFDTGAWPDPSPTTYDYASHGVIGWDSSTKSVGVTTMVLDENLVEVDLVTLASGVSVTRMRGDVTEQLNSVTGFTTIPNDVLEFSIPVRNQGILPAPSTEIEITSPDGSTSRANIPSLPALGEVRVDVQWTVPSDQAIGDSLLQFEVDPDSLVTADANRTNNADVFNIFVGRLPVADLAQMNSFYTFTTVVLDASSSNDPDGFTDIYCYFMIEDPLAVDDNDGDPTDGFIERVIYTDSTEDCVVEWSWDDDGEYEIGLSIVDDEGDTTVTNMTVEVLNRAPEVVVSSDRSSIPVMDPITFNVFQHSDVDTITPEAPVDFLWDADCEQGRVTQLCTVTPLVEGIYTMSASVTDDDGAVTSSTHSINVTNIAPWNASISASHENGTPLEMDSQMVWHVLEDQPIVFTGTAEDSSNDIPSLSYEWWPDVEVDPTNSSKDDEAGASSLLTYSYETHGMHVINMQVSDNDDLRTSIARGWLMVQNVPPTIDPFSSQLPIAEDQILSVTGSFHDTSSDIETLRACWDINPASNTDSEGSAEDDCDIEGADLAYSWPDAATAPSQIVFHVTDDDGERAVEMLNITVRNLRPKGAINVTEGPFEVGQEIVFSGEGTTDSSQDMPRLTYRWDFNTAFDSDDDGFTANDIEDQGFTVSHTFTEPGTYIVRLTVGDESEEDTVDVQILVENTRFLGLNVGFGEGSTTTVVILILTLVLLSLLVGIGIMRRGRVNEFDPYGTIQTNQFNIGGAQPSMPNAPPPTYAFGFGGGAPPVPAEGLPAGWTLEQWNHYGQQWLDAQQPPSSSPVSQSTISEPTYASPEPTYATLEPTYASPEPTYAPPEPTYASPEPTYVPPVESGKSRELSEPLPSTDILDFDL